VQPFRVESLKVPEFVRDLTTLPEPHRSRPHIDFFVDDLDVQLVGTTSHDLSSRSFDLFSKFLIVPLSDSSVSRPWNGVR
jgi:hypothetical protein